MSPFRSEKQRRYLFRNKPKIAEKWAEEEELFSRGRLSDIRKKKMASNPPKLYTAAEMAAKKKAEAAARKAAAAKKAAAKKKKDKAWAQKLRAASKAGVVDDSGSKKKVLSEAQAMGVIKRAADKYGKVETAKIKPYDKK